MLTRPILPPAGASAQEGNALMLETLPGQAHFVVADAKRTCRECEHWANQSGERSREGLLKEARCQKARIGRLRLETLETARCSTLKIEWLFLRTQR